MAGIGGQTKSFYCALFAYIYLAYLPGQCSDRLVTFEWDPAKARENLEKHGAAFETACYAFADPNRVIEMDESHSLDEPRYFC